MKQYDDIWINGLLAKCEGGYGLVPQGAIAVKNGVIAWIGRMSDLTKSPEELAEWVHDLEGRCLTPGLIDCHTHIIYAGSRAHEFEQRLTGVSYETIAKQGGGIASTVKATREATDEFLFTSAKNRINALMQSGVTTIEIKSGYGLNWVTERKMLLVASKLENELPITIKKTFLGAHTIPGEYKNKTDDYVTLLCDEMIPQVATEHLADAVDVFCETIAFNLEQTKRIFEAAQSYHLMIKCHAEQLSAMGSAELAAHFAAVSVDHLEYLSERGAHAMRQAGSVAVLLPGAYYFLQETKKPPVALLRQNNIPIAIASDHNPGTSPFYSLTLIMNMACTLFNMTPEEALLGVTLHAALSLGLEKTHGSLTVGKVADFAIWDVSHPIDIIYFVGLNQLVMRVKLGKIVY